MERLVQNGKTYSYYEYGKEQEFEQVIVEQAGHIFGSSSIYIDY